MLDGYLINHLLIIRVAFNQKIWCEIRITLCWSKGDKKVCIWYILYILLKCTQVHRLAPPVGPPQRLDSHHHRGVVKVHWRVPWVGGLFSWVVATFTLWSKCCHRGCLNNLIFSNLGLCAACWAHVVCYHELWLTSVRHPLSFLNRF